MRTILAGVLALTAGAAVSAQGPGDPYPKSVAEFRSAVEQVLSETGVAGAGIALVRASGVEWAGGVGLADRDRNIPVTADTHFRAGSISKTFIASAVVQAYLDDILDLDAPVSQYVPEVAIDNAWDPTDPVRVIHLLQHTAGFDDMHFNEIFAPDGPELSLEEVLKLNPASRVVRWQPGTRMAYSNPGYAVAALVLEKVSGKKYEEWIEERIFKPTGMPTSSFRLTKADEALLAKGYDSRTGPPLPYSQIYLRPAGNLHTSALELGRFVQLLLNWGETQDDLVIDPEYLSNMEHPRTTLASQAGLRSGYGSGIVSFFDDGFPMLGHNGGIEGFSSFYGYSTSRDVGYVILLNSRASPEAMRRIRTLAVRYLKADVEPPSRPAVDVPVETLLKYAGYYHDAAPRTQALAFLTWLMAGQSITVDGKQLRSTPVFGTPAVLVPTSDTMFRLDADPEPTRVFVPGDADQMILTGGLLYAERWPRWRIEGIRWAVLASAGIVLTPLPMAVIWIVLRLTGRSGPQSGWLKFSLVLCALAFALPAAGFMTMSGRDFATINVRTAAMFAGSMVLPAAAIVSFLFAIDAWRSGVRPWLRAYSLTVSIAALIISGYLSAWGMIGFRPWTF
jgi:CubicO group peptidase (beta-lactamase class C family)